MVVKVNMPKLSDTIEEGVLHKWNVKEGDKVESGDIVAEVETDKATMDVEVFDDGTILKIMVDEGDSVPLGEKMSVIAEEGEDISGMIEGGEEEKEEKEEKEAGEEEESAKSDKELEKETEEDMADGQFAEAENEGEKPAARAQSGNGRIKASPLAKKMAEDQGID